MRRVNQHEDDMDPPSLSLSLSSPQPCRVARKRVAETTVHACTRACNVNNFRDFPLHLEFIRHALYFVSSTRLAEFNLSCPRRGTLVTTPTRSRLFLTANSRIFEFHPLGIDELTNDNCLNAIIFVYTIWSQKNNSRVGSFSRAGLSISSSFSF